MLPAARLALFTLALAPAVAAQPVQAIPVIKLEDPAATTADSFATTVAVDGDTMALLDGNNLSDPKRVLIYRHDGRGWVLEDELEAGDGVLQEFGRALALDGDRLVLGEPRADVLGADDAGLVQVYERQGGQWSLQSEVLPPELVAGRRFGQTVDLDGDTLVVGYGKSTFPYVFHQRVAIFVEQGGAWVEQAELQAGLTADPAAQFGYSLSLDGDRLAVGAPTAVSFDESIGGEVTGFGAFGAGPLVTAEPLPPGGAVFLFERSAGVWTPAGQVTTRDGDPAETSDFGFEVALEGDRLAVSRRFGAFGPEASGLMGIFEHDGEGWRTEAMLGGLDLPLPVRLSHALSLSGDVVLQDGYVDFVGAVVAVWVRRPDGWHGEALLMPSDGADAPLFGQDLAVSGQHVVVSASKAPTAGAAYVFELQGLP